MNDAPLPRPLHQRWALRFATRACREYGAELLAGAHPRTLALQLADIEGDDREGWCALEAALREAYEANPLGDDRRRAAFSNPAEMSGDARIWLGLYLLHRMATAIRTYVFDEPVMDDEDMAVVCAWVADSARTLALLDGGEALAREEDLRQQREWTEREVDAE